MINPEHFTRPVPHTPLEAMLSAFQVASDHLGTLIMKGAATDAQLQTFDQYELAANQIVTHFMPPDTELGIWASSFYRHDSSDTPWKQHEPADWLAYAAPITGTARGVKRIMLDDPTTKEPGLRLCTIVEATRIASVVSDAPFKLAVPISSLLSPAHR